MNKSNINNKLIKDRLGYYQLSKKPTWLELKEYYTKKYYQDPSGQYKKKYSDEELTFFNNKANLCIHTLKKYDIDVYGLFEIGCGEGFFANVFFEKKIKLFLNDLSPEGIKRFNPHLFPYLKTIDIYDHIENMKSQNNKFNLISMDNVLEHVLEPKLILSKLKEIMDINTILRITVPNDFSAFQNMLIKSGKATNTWVCPPDHITYFNSQNIITFCKSEGFNVLSVQCGFPIEIFLLNSHSHYYNNKSVGKDAHLTRVVCTNYLINQDIDSFIALSESAAKLQYGRDVTIYLTL